MNPPLSTLNESTPLDIRRILSLIYWTLSDSSKAQEQITSQATEAPTSSDVRPVAPTSGHAAGRSKSGFLSAYHYQSLIRTRPYSVRNTHTTGRSSVSPGGIFLTSNVNDVSRSSPPVNVENESGPESPVVFDGGLSDHDEMNGNERLAAVNSPLKAGKRVNSDVRMLWLLQW
jgi:hypothetical protein